MIDSNTRFLKAEVQRLVDTLGDGSPTWRYVAQWLSELYYNRTGEDIGIKIPDQNWSNK